MNDKIYVERRTFPADGQERRYVVLGEEDLLVDHLDGDDELGEHDETVTCTPGTSFTGTRGREERRYP